MPPFHDVMILGERIQEGRLLEHIMNRGNTLFLAGSWLHFALDTQEVFVVDPQIYWIANFSTIYDDILLRIGSAELTSLLKSFRHGINLFDPSQLLRIDTLDELELNEGQVRRFCERSFELFRMFPSNRREGFYSLFYGSQERKLVCLSLLVSLFFRKYRRKFVLFLRRAELPLEVITPYLRTGIVIKFLSLLRLTQGEVHVIIPCSRKVLKEFKEMCEYAELAT